MTVLVWFLMVASLVGFGVSTYNAYDAVLDLRALDTVHPQVDSRRLIARANLRTQAFRMFELLLFFIVSLLAAANAELELRRFVTTTGLSAVAVLIIVNSIHDRYVKSRLLRRIHLEEDRAVDRGRVHEAASRDDPPSDRLP